MRTGLEPATLGVTGRYSNQLNYRTISASNLAFYLAVRTGLEPATLGVTGRYSNQLNYRTKFYSSSFCISQAELFMQFLKHQL